MGIQKENDALFALIRQQFFDDPEENIEKLRDCAQDFGNKPEKAVSEMLLALHNLKGSAQVVGFPHFADTLHSVEDAVEHMRRLERSHPLFPTIIAMLVKICEELDDSFQKMRQAQEDCPEADEAFLACLKELKDHAHEAKRKEQDRMAEVVLAPVEETKSAAPVGWGLFDDDDVPSPAAPSAPAPEVVAAAAEEKPEPIPAIEVPREAIGPPKVLDSKFLLMEQAEQLFAVSIADVKEIISGHPINPLPEGRNGLKGMIVVRDRTLPVIDLDEVFGQLGKALSEGERNCAVICESADQSFAFRVEKPRQVISLNAGDFESLDSKFGAQIGQSVIKKVARYNGKSVLVIDLNLLLQDK